VATIKATEIRDCLVKSLFEVFKFKEIYVHVVATESAKRFFDVGWNEKLQEEGEDITTTSTNNALLRPRPPYIEGVFDKLVKIKEEHQRHEYRDINDSENEGGVLYTKFYNDSSEWQRWGKRGDTVTHIDLRNKAEVCVIAPCSANTLGKIANGLCDNLATSIIRAWDFKKPLLIAPAMNTAMWENPITKRQLDSIRANHIEIMNSQNQNQNNRDSTENVNDDDDDDDDDDKKKYRRGIITNTRAPTATTTGACTIIKPIEKTLMCGDFGQGAMAEPDTIARAATEALLKHLDEKIAMDSQRSRRRR